MSERAKHEENKENIHITTETVKSTANGIPVGTSGHSLVTSHISGEIAETGREPGGIIARKPETGRVPLRSIKILTAIPVEDKCPVCGLFISPEMDRSISSAEMGRGMTSEPFGVKYLDGIPHVLMPLNFLRESGRRVILPEEEIEYLSQVCSCTVQLTGVCSPVGSRKNLENAFFPVPGESSRSLPRSLSRLSPAFTNYQAYSIEVEEILSGADRRTTCMIKNIPNKLTVTELIRILQSIHTTAFDFLYLRMDFKSKCNNGYAFINFRDYRYILIFLDIIKGSRWKNHNSDKVGDMTYARIQGLPMLQSRFKRSDILLAPPCFWPIIFDEYGQPLGPEVWGFPSSGSTNNK